MDRSQLLIAAGGSVDNPVFGARCQMCRVRNHSVGYRDRDGYFFSIGGKPEWDDYSYTASYQSAKLTAQYASCYIDRTVKYIVVVLWRVCVDGEYLALCQHCCHQYHKQQRERVAAITHTKTLMDNGQIPLPLGVL